MREALREAELECRRKAMTNEQRAREDVGMRSERSWRRINNAMQVDVGWAVFVEPRHPSTTTASVQGGLHLQLSQPHLHIFIHCCRLCFHPTPLPTAT